MVSGPTDPAYTVPAWVRLLGMPVWVTGADGAIAYLNPRAESLLGATASECIGKACHSVVGGKTPYGAPFCHPDCAVRRMASEGREIEPFSLLVPGRDGPDDHIRVVVIAAQSPPAARVATTLYVHCVVDDARHERFRRYLDRVVSRSHRADPGDLTIDEFQLTPREREILRLLAEDETLHGIAHRLNLSYATIRNHVQHILGKLGVHSILEAVAFYLLIED